MPYVERVELLHELIVGSPGCAIATFDQPVHFVDPSPLFSALAIDISGHPVLEGRSAIEYVEVDDMVRVGPACETAATCGAQSIGVRLRSGGDAILTYIDLQVEHGMSVAVFTPTGGHRMPTRPLPTTLNAAPRLGVFHRNRSGTIIDVDQGFVALLGWTPGEVLGNGSLTIVHPEDHAQGITNWIDMLDRPGEACRWRCRYMKADGSWLWVESTNLYREAESDIRTELLNVDAEVRAQDELAAREEVLRVLAEALPVGVARLDPSGVVEYANDRLEALLGLDRLQTSAQLTSTTADRAGELADAIEALLNDGRPGRINTTCAPHDGDLRHLEWTLRPLHERSGACAGGIVCVADVTEAAELRARLEHEATTDALTQCRNRAATLEAVHGALRRAGTGGGVAVVFVDLNAFKPVNDRHGHAIGDELLTIVAARIRTAVRPGDVVGRIGGDEFVVVSPGVPDRAVAGQLADRIAELLHGEAVIAGIGGLMVTASIGVAWAAGGPAEDLIAAADRAMYAAKRSGTLTPVLAS